MPRHNGNGGNGNGTGRVWDTPTPESRYLFDPESGKTSKLSGLSPDVTAGVMRARFRVAPERAAEFCEMLRAAYIARADEAFDEAVLEGMASVPDLPADTAASAEAAA